MPPSGFSQKEAKMLKDFAESIFGRCKEEARQRQETLSQAVGRELGTIENLLQAATPAEKGSLELARSAYEVLRSNQYDITAACEDLKQATLGIRA